MGDPAYRVRAKKSELRGLVPAGAGRRRAARWDSEGVTAALATAILDRLLHHCEVIAVNGPGCRLKDRFQAIERETEAA
ncbi:ATP-binding protein [Streptomyces sp. NPDC004237]|uniref:ATP-binding protein n=1 Tax=Streptomyces sp. NPDC004237 TaxID=3154455 RepID=UPI0033A857B1